jgi:gliding-associated putative ABC transporter substrate-binding component GldG
MISAAKKRVLKRGKNRGVVVMAVAVFIALAVVNFLASRHFFRFDITEKKEYTLSDATKNILKNLDDVVNVDIYFSQKVPPAVLKLRREVDDVLLEYKTYAGNDLHVRYIDPQESPQKEYSVQLMGIPPVQANVIERDKQEVVKLFLGIAVTHEDRKEIIPVVRDSRNLEYDLTSAILTVSKEKKAGITWLAKKDEREFDGAKELLRRRYDVRDADARMPGLDPVKDALLIVSMDGDLSDAELFDIDQYLMKGGRVIMLVDRVRVANNLQPSKIDLPNTLAWLGNNGMDVEDKLVLDRVNAHAAFTSAGAFTFHVPYPYWVRVVSQGFDAASPPVSDLETLVLPWTSPIAISGARPEGIEYTILAKSSPVNGAASLTESLAPEEMNGRRLGIAQSEPKALVVMAAGRLKSYYGEGGKPAPVKGAEVVSESTDGQLMVVGDSRFVQNGFLQQFAVNTVFFENIVDYMALGSELIGIRSKAVTDRPLKEAPEASISMAKYVNLAGAPFVVILIGLVVWFFGRHKRRLLRGV